jgi:hypothetical protein
MCASKSELPTLQGHRYKTRTRDKKIKFDAESFAETLIAKLNGTDGSVEGLSNVLDKNADQLDYRLYSEPLLEILIAGGILAPGGKIESDPIFAYCVFSSAPNVDSIKHHIQVLTNLLRRYRYLQKQVKDVVTKVVNYLKAFTDSQKQCLSIYTALCISEGVLTVDIVNGLFAEHLVKEENLSLLFTVVLFRTWIGEKGINNVGSSLRKNKLEDQLLNILPLSRRTEENFDKHFIEAGLQDLVTFRKAQQNIRIKKKLKIEIDEYLESDFNPSIIIDHCQEVIESSTLTDVHVVTLMWKSVMETGDWTNRREDLLPDLLEEHLQKYSVLFEPFCERGTSQLILLREIQNYCYKNPTFFKLFHKIVLHLYLSEFN